MRRTTCLLAVTMVAAASAPGTRAETEPLLEDPVGIVGVVPTPLGGHTLTLGGLFDQARRGPLRDTDGGFLEAEAGIARGFDLRFAQIAAYGRAAPYQVEGAGRVWGGGSRLGVRWQFVEEGDAVPAIGVYGALTALYGESRPAQDADIVALMSKTLRGGERPLALYLNAGWTERLNPQPGERAGRYGFAAGLAHTLRHDTSAAVTYAVAQQDRGERDQQVVQGGIWHRLGGGGPVVSISVGAGLNEDSPRLQVGFAVKWLFGGE
jgi:hypothetical protein